MVYHIPNDAILPHKCIYSSSWYLTIIDYYASFVVFQKHNKHWKTAGTVMGFVQDHICSDRADHRPVLGASPSPSPTLILEFWQKGREIKKTTHCLPCAILYLVRIYGAQPLRAVPAWRFSLDLCGCISSHFFYLPCCKSVLQIATHTRKQLWSGQCRTC